MSGGVGEAGAAAARPAPGRRPRRLPRRPWPMGFTQRQAAGKFTRDEAAALSRC